MDHQSYQTGSDVFSALRKLSINSERCWIASPYLGSEVRNILGDAFAYAKDKRLIVNLESAFVDKWELSWFKRLPNMELRTLRALHAKLYIFDTGSIISSANLTVNAAYNVEVGTQTKGIIDIQQSFLDLWSKARKITPKEIASR